MGLRDFWEARYDAMLLKSTKFHDPEIPAYTPIFLESVAAR